jgi:hypothetical protein
MLVFHAFALLNRQLTCIKTSQYGIMPVATEDTLVQVVEQMGQQIESTQNAISAFRVKRTALEADLKALKQYRKQNPTLEDSLWKQTPLVLKQSFTQ